jgi:hypothetical protein
VTGLSRRKLVGTAAAFSVAMRLLVSLIVVALFAAPAEAGKRKNVGLSFLLSFGGTFASYAGAGAVQHLGDEDDWGKTMFAGAVLIAVGPSLGNVYNGEHRRAAVTAGIRGGAMALLFFGGGEAFDHASEHQEEGFVAMAVGGVAFVGSTIYDWIDAPLAAQRHNARMTVAPSVLPAKDGLAPGLVLAGSF